MKIDKTPGILHIATGDWEIVKDTLNQFNTAYPDSRLQYHTSVRIDGVLFSYIDTRDADVDHVFLFGATFGDRIKELRDNGEINW